MLKLNKTALAVLMLCLAGASVAPAQSSDYGVPSDDWNYSDPDIRQTVARVGYISGDVSFARGDDPDDWQPADSNVPMTLGDRVWTSGGRLELQVHGGSYIRLARSTDLTALNLTEDTKQFSMTAGVASFRVPRLADDEVYEVDTPNAAVTFERTGDYRIDVRPNGDTRVQVRSGRAIVASAGGQVPLGSGSAMVIEGSEPPRYDVVGMPQPDGWDGWVRDRDARFANVQSYNYVSRDIAGVEDLDQYGRWQQVPSYGWCWTPTRIAVGWQPYRVGRWIWQDPWGWTWVSTEPWGWAPYHYGRWVTVSSNWFWVPVAPRVPVVTYSPALVAFVGGGPGFSVSVGVGADYIGWFPLAPRDPFIPWWGRPATTVVNVTNVTYVNQTYVTVVKQNTFVTSQVVNTNYVRDQNIVRRVESAPVMRGQVPVAPTRESIRGTTRQARAVRPPANIAQRTVVSHVAPPPAPPRFDTKVATIREQKRPVTTVEAERMVQREGRAAPSKAVRPASEQNGRVAFQPKTNNTTQPKAEPIASSRGRQLSTKEQPTAPLSDRPAVPRGRPSSDTRAQTSQQDSQQKEQADRDQAAREQRDKALQQDRAPQEQNQRDQADRLQQQREQAQRDQAQKEQTQREQAQRDQREKQQAQQDQLEKQQAQRDRARQEQLERQEAQRQQDQREQLERQKAQQQDDARRDQLEKQQREQQERQKAQRDQAQREQAQKQQNERQQVQRQQAPRPTARPAEDLPDHPERSEARQSNANNKDNDKDKDNKDKTPNSSQKGRGRPTPKPTPDKNS